MWEMNRDILFSSVQCRIMPIQVRILEHCSPYHIGFNNPHAKGFVKTQQCGGSVRGAEQLFPQTPLTTGDDRLPGKLDTWVSIRDGFTFPNKLVDCRGNITDGGNL
jgi:hypothetical protein